MSKKSPLLSDQFGLALTFANSIHNKQTRKTNDGKRIPYISHLMAVSASVLEHGGGETEAIAALLHDSAEDQGGAAMLNTVRTMFGDAVAAIVADCTDTMEEVKPDWKARKVAYVEHLRNASPSSQLVAGCDKLHNLSCTVRDLKQNPGSDYWNKFCSGATQQYWYYGECLKALEGNPVESEFREKFKEFEALLVDRRDLVYALKPFGYDEALRRELASNLVGQVVEEAKRSLMSMKVTLSGEDSGLTNVWEEICVQLQGEESAFGDAYEFTARQTIEGAMLTFAPLEKYAVWLDTEEGSAWVWNCESNVSDEGCFSQMFEEDVVAEIQKSLFKVAINFENERIRQFFESRYEPD